MNAPCTCGACFDCRGTCGDRFVRDSGEWHWAGGGPLPDFPRYTGVHPAPSPVRREEPDWESYTTKTVAERRAALVRHDAIASCLESPSGTKPTEEAAHLHQEAPPSEWNFGLGPATAFVSKAQVAAFYGRGSIAASRGLAEMKSGLKAFIDEHSPDDDRVTNSLDAFREARRAFDAGEIQAVEWEYSAHNRTGPIVTTTPWPTPGDNVAVVGDRDRSKDPPLKFVFIEDLRR